MGFLKNNVVIGIIAIIILSAAGAYYLMREPESDSLLISESVGQGGVDRELLTTLLELKSLRFESGIFEDNTFNNLKDFSREIPDEPYGRPNPFAPVGKDVQAGATSTTSR